MKQFKKIIIFILITCSLTGCAATPVPYSFAQNESESASINFISGNPGVMLIYSDGYELPKPEAKTRWEPILFPAGRSLRLTVNLFFRQPDGSNSGVSVLLATGVRITPNISVRAVTDLVPARNISGDVIFDCPPLEAGKNYNLTYRKGAGMSGKNFLVLTEADTGKVIREQEF